MADRTTKVTLTAVVDGYVTGLQRAQQATKKFTDDSVKQAQAQGDALRSVGKVAGVAMLAAGAVVAAGIGLAVKKFEDFDAQMAQVQALSHATAAEMGMLTNAALTVGQKFGYSATQVAEAETELIKAGISLKDIMGGALTGALTLAADGQMNVADATQIAGEAMTQFNLQGKDVPHIADLLAAGADKALGSVGDLGQALESGGLVAHQFGLSLDDTVGTLAAFAQSGLIGETAGTDLRQMLLKLANPSAQASSTMKDLGINLYNAQGHFVGITNLSGQLATKMKGLSEAQRNQALATIFGSRAIAGANVLVNEGAKGIQGWIDKVNDQGFAAEQAEKKLNSLQGDVQKLSAAFDTDLIRAGSGANVMLRGLVQTATDVLNGFGALPVPLQQVALGFAGVVSAMTLIGGAAVLGLPKIIEFKGSLDVLAKSDLPGVAGAARGASSALSGVARVLSGPWLLVIAAAIAGTIALAKAIDTTKGSVDDIENALKASTSGFTSFKAAVASATPDNLVGQWKAGLTTVNTDAKSLRAALEQAAGASTHFWTSTAPTEQDTAIQKALKNMGTALGVLAATDLPAAQKGFANFTESYKLNTAEQWRALNQMPDYLKALKDQATQQGVTSSKTNLLKLANGELTESQKKAKLASENAKVAAAANAKALAGLSGQAVDTDGKIQSLADTISGFGKGALDVSAAERDFHQAIDDASASIKKNGKTLDDNTQAGRDNGATLDTIAKNALALASSQATAGASQNSLTKTMQAGRTAFIKAAEAAGLTKNAANKLADSYGLIPSNVQTSIHVTGADKAKKDANAVRDAVNGIPVSKQISVFYKTYGLPGASHSGDLLKVGNQARGSVLDFYANGGMREQHVAQIAPAGSWRVWAEPETGGEAYIPLAPAKRDRSLSIWEATGRRLGVQGFADGGITYAQAPPAYSSAAPVQVVQPSIKVIVQPKGGVDLLKYVDVRVEQTRTADTNTARRGSRGIL